MFRCYFNEISGREYQIMFNKSDILVFWLVKVNVAESL